MSSNSLLLSLFSSGDERGDAQQQHELRLERNLNRIQSQIDKMRKEQRTLSLEEQKHIRAMERAIKRGNQIEARRCAVQATQTRKQIDLLEKAQTPLNKAYESAFYARQNIGVNGAVEETIKAIDESNRMHNPRQAARMLPAAMRVGQTLKMTSDQYREASNELNDALEYSDDDEEDLREDADRAMATDPTAVHTTTNPELLLRYAQESHSLLNEEKLSRHNTRRVRDVTRATRRVERTAPADDEEGFYFSLSGNA